MKRTTGTTGTTPSLTIGIDVGGTKVLAGVVDRENRVLGRGKLKSPFEDGPGKLAEVLVGAADAALEEAGASRDDVAAIGVGVPGPVDARRGVLLTAVNLGVEDFDVAGALAPAFPGVACAVQNDVRVAALAEARLGAAVGRDLVVAIWVGTGIGGGVVWHGKVWMGSNLNAGEIGHTQVDWRRAAPGRPDGELEGIGAKVGMTRWLKRKVEEGEHTALADAVTKKGGRLKGKEIVKAFEEGDPLTVRAVERSARVVGISIANLYNVFAPDAFVLGGGVAVDLGAAYLDRVRATAREFVFFRGIGEIQILPAALGDDAGLLGAALLAREAGSGAV